MRDFLIRLGFVVLFFGAYALVGTLEARDADLRGPIFVAEVGK